MLSGKRLNLIIVIMSVPHYNILFTVTALILIIKQFNYTFNISKYIFYSELLQTYSSSIYIHFSWVLSIERIYSLVKNGKTGQAVD